MSASLASAWNRLSRFEVNPLTDIGRANDFSEPAGTAASARAATARRSAADRDTLSAAAGAAARWRAAGFGRSSRSSMSAAGVTPPIGDGAALKPYATAPSSLPLMYTGEPDMPDQMPPPAAITCPTGQVGDLDDDHVTAGTDAVL